MNTYTEKEVKGLLETQRGNCWVALSKVSKNADLLTPVIEAPEPGQWKENRKQYFLIMEDQYDIPEQKELSEQEILDLIKQTTTFTPIDPSPPFRMNLEVQVTKETKEFLENTCNVEISSNGKRLYVLNELKFQIIDI